jgi:hypothetical protein
MNPITNQSLIDELEGRRRTTAAAQPQTSNMVTDKKLLDELNAGAQPESNLQTLGRSTASLADTALNTLTGTMDIGARALARAYYGGVKGMPQAQAEQLAQQEGTSPKDMVGRAFGVTGTAGYENAPLRSAGRAIGEALGSKVIEPISSATGLPEGYVGDVVGLSAMGLAPGAGRAVSATGRGVATAGRATGDVLGGAYGTATGKIARPGAVPEAWQQPSSRVPVGAEYLPAEQLAAWRSGQLSTQQAQAAMRPSTDLPQKALSRTKGNIPYQGQTARALGEQIGEVYRNPLNVLTDVGLDVLTGGPVPTMGRLGYKGYELAQQARGARELGKYGFTQMTPDELAALQTGRNLPQYQQPVAGPVAPAQAAQMAAAQRIIGAPPVARPPNTMQMATAPVKSVVYPSREAFEQATMFDRIAGKEVAGSFKEGNKIITYTPWQHPWPFTDRPKPAPTVTAVDAATGQRVPVGKTWTEADPAPSGSLIRQRMSRGKQE